MSMSDTVQSCNAGGKPCEAPSVHYNDKSCVQGQAVEGRNCRSLDHDRLPRDSCDNAVDTGARSSRRPCSLDANGIFPAKRPANLEVSHPPGPKHDAKSCSLPQALKSRDESAQSVFQVEFHMTLSATSSESGYSTRNAGLTQPDPASPLSGNEKHQATHSELTNDAKVRYPELIPQPASSPISQDQLVAEVQVIYAGLLMVETKCINIDAVQAADPGYQLGHEQWKALITLHRTLLYEHHDFLLATQHPSATQALRGLAAEYSMPARMWKHGIYAFIELVLIKQPECQDYMLEFIDSAYQMMALLVETVPAFSGTWIECLAELARYRMTIEEEKETRAIWARVAVRWYTMSQDRLLADFLASLELSEPDEPGKVHPLKPDSDEELHDTWQGVNAFAWLYQGLALLPLIDACSLLRGLCSQCLPSRVACGLCEYIRKAGVTGKRLVAVRQTWATLMPYRLASATPTGALSLARDFAHEQSVGIAGSSADEALRSALQLFTGLVIIAAVGNIVRMAIYRPEARPAWSPHFAVGLSVITLIVDWTAPNDKPLRNAAGSGCFLALSHYIVKECLMVPSSRVLLWAPLLIGVALSVACSVSTTPLHESESTFSELVAAGLPAAAVFATLTAYFLPDLIAQKRMFQTRNRVFTGSEDTDAVASTTGRFDRIQVRHQRNDRGTTQAVNGDLENQYPAQENCSTWSASSQAFTGLTAAGFARQHNGNHNDQRVFNLYYGQHSGQTTDHPSPADRSLWA